MKSSKFILSLVNEVIYLLGTNFRASNVVNKFVIMQYKNKVSFKNKRDASENKNILSN